MNERIMNVHLKITNLRCLLLLVVVVAFVPVVAFIIVVVDSVVAVVVVVRSTEQRVLSSNNRGINCHCRSTPEAGQLFFKKFFKNFGKQKFKQLCFFFSRYVVATHYYCDKKVFLLLLSKVVKGVFSLLANAALSQPTVPHRISSSCSCHTTHTISLSLFSPVSELTR